MVYRFHLISKEQVWQLRRACAEIVIYFAFAPPEPLHNATYCMHVCSSAVITACSTAVVSTGYEPPRIRLCQQMVNTVAFSVRIKGAMQSFERNAQIDARVSTTK